MPAILLANPYVDIILALALAWLSLKIIRALFGPLEGVPGVGSYIAKAEHAIAQSVSHACGQIAEGASLAVGGSLHTIARLIERSGASLRRPALALVAAADLILGTRAAIHGLRAIVNKAVGSVGAVLPRVKTLEREYHGIEHRVKTLEREIAKGIGHDLRIHVKALERWEEAAKKQLAADEKAITKTLPAELGQVEDWLGMELDSTRAKWLAGFATLALAEIGLGGLSCNSNPWKNNPNACGLWGDLADLLGLALALGFALDFETFVHDAQGATEATASAVKEFVGLAG